MTTPYDPALRIRRREIDDVRVAIEVEAGALSHVEAARAAVDAAIERERAFAAADPLLSAHAYVARMRGERARLDDAGRTIGARLDALRDDAAAAFGSLRAIEGAADDWRDEAARAAAVAEQARIDDFAAAAFVRARRAR